MSGPLLFCLWPLVALGSAVLALASLLLLIAVPSWPWLFFAVLFGALSFYAERQAGCVVIYNIEEEFE